MADHRDKILQLIRLRGPLLPSEINKEIGTNTLFASAMLSELVDNKVIRLSNVKVGGSPLYYYPGQENRLQQYSNKLHEKEQRVYHLLKEKKVLKDKDQDPLTRVALRSIKDFAKPVEVSYNGESILFWKWYLLSGEETESIIGNILGVREEKSIQDKKAAENIGESIQTKVQEEKQKVIEEKISDKIAERQQPIVEKIKEKLREIPITIQTIQQTLQRTEEKKQERHETAKEKIERITERNEQKKESEESMMPVDRGYPSGDKLFSKVNRFFEQNHIVIEDFKIIRKGADIDFRIKVPSNVGVLRYFCKAKDKKRINEGDLSAVYLQGSKTKLPILLLITGEMTKKLEKDPGDDFRGITIKRI